MVTSNLASRIRTAVFRRQPENAEQRRRKLELVFSAILRVLRVSAVKEKLLSSRAFPLAALAIAGLCIAASSVRNPVLPGDHPDPSVIRVGKEYWAANTSSEWAPIFPLSVSTDLQHWKAAGAVFQTPPAWASANFWAPELTLDRGAVRVYYAARKRGGPLCVAVATAARPQGPYSDHGPMVCQDDGSIDPFFLRDGGGHPYLIWKEDANSRRQPSTIFAQPTTDDGLQLTGQPTPLIRSDVAWEGNVVEGPDIVRHGDYYYLLYAGGACCGRACNYGVGVARAKNLLGPWEKDPANPIVTANAEWKCPGHGTAVEGPGGRDYFLYHAYAQKGFVFTGREALIDEIEWRDGWPVIGGGTGASGGGSLPEGVTDDFRAKTLAGGWQWPLGTAPRIETGGGHLLLDAPMPEGAGFPGAILARSLASVDYTVEVTLDAKSLATAQSAGLAIVGDPRNTAGIGIVDGRVTQWRIEGGKWTKLAEAPEASAALVRLRIQATQATRFRTWFASGSGQWTQLGDVVDVSALPPWDRGLRAALYAGRGARAQFSRFDLRYRAPE